MAFIPIPNVAETNILFAVSSLSFTNTLYWLDNAGWTQAKLDALTQQVSDAWETHMLPNQCNIISLIGVDGRDLTTQDGIFSNFRTNPIPVGGDGGPPASLNNSMTITLRTATVGRSFRGRIYVAGLPESKSDIDSWDVSFVNDMSNDFEAFDNLVSIGTGANLVVASRYSNGVPRNPGIATVVTDTGGNPPVASQRKRIPR